MPLTHPREIAARLEPTARAGHIAAVMAAGLRRRLCRALFANARPHRAPARWLAERGPAAVERATKT